jgi:hypothetical protein
MYVYIYIKQSQYRAGLALSIPGVWGSQIPRQSAHEGGNVVNPKHRSPLTPGIIFGTHSCCRLSQPEGHCVARRIMSMKISSDTIGNWTHIYIYIYMCVCVCAGCLSRYSDWLLVGRSGDRIPVRTRFFTPVQTGPGAHPASCTMGTGSYSGVESGRGVTLSYHPLLGPRPKNRLQLYLYSP